MANNIKQGPNLFFIIFLLIMLSIWLRIPLIMFAAIAYVIYRFANPGTRQNRSRRRDRSRGRSYEAPRQRRRATDFDRTRKSSGRRSPERPAPKPRPRNNPFKKSGKEKFEEYDYGGAIEDFSKALETNPEDIAVHFNIACAYSLTEQKENSFHHLSEAVRLGFSDVEKINNHEALAYIRIQPEFEEFSGNGYRWPLSSKEKTQQENPVTEVSTEKDLLEQLQQLASLRERGLLTQEEYEIQKQRLLR